MSEFITLIATNGIWVGLLIWVINNPEKSKKWFSIIVGVFGFLWKGSQYWRYKHETEGRLNLFARNLEKKIYRNQPRIRIQWTAREDKEEIIWEEGEVILVVKDREHKARNMAHTALLFTSNILLRKPKRYISQQMKTSVDLFTTKCLLESEGTWAVQQFMDDYFIPYIDSNDSVREYVRQYKYVDDLGIYFPVFIQELMGLGDKLFLAKPGDKITHEVKKLLEFLVQFSKRNVGDDTTDDSFAGEYTRCSIKIVATSYTIEENKTENQVNRLMRAIGIGFENIYIIGPARKAAKNFINQVIEKVTLKKPFIEKIRALTFSGKVFVNNEPRNVVTYFVHLRNPQVTEVLSLEK